MAGTFLSPWSECFGVVLPGLGTNGRKPVNTGATGADVPPLVDPPHENAWGNLALGLLVVPRLVNPVWTGGD